MEQDQKAILGVLKMNWKRILSTCLCLIYYAQLQAQKEDFVQTDFKKADSVAAAYTRHSLKDIRSLAMKLTQPLLTDQEKFRALYKWTCSNIEYDYALYIKNKQKKKIHDRQELQAWNKKFNALVFKNLLHKKKTVCSGYAYLLRELATHAGLSCVIIDGYGRSSISNVRGPGDVNHSWNAIQLQGKWYLCDATWSSGAIDTKALKFVKDYDDTYFLPDPSLFIRSHYPADSSWMLMPHKPTLTAFLNGPLIGKAAFRYKIVPTLHQAFDITADKGKALSFQFITGSNEALENMTMFSEGPNRSVAFHPPLYRDSEGVYCNDIIFNSKGMHLVHVFANNGHAFTYAVKVK